jgi:hypothetical protein
MVFVDGILYLKMEMCMIFVVPNIVFHNEALIKVDKFDGSDERTSHNCRNNMECHIGSLKG